MENLTTEELKVINNSTLVLNRDVSLGTIIQNIINELPTEGTPVNALNATKVLTISGVVIDGETVTIDNPVIAGTNVYEFLADAAQSKSAPTNIAVNIEARTTKASRTLTVDTQPTSGDTMTVGTKVYTFVPVGTNNADGEISVCADLATAQAAIVAAVNGTDEVNESHPLVSAGAFAGNFCILTALIGGVTGDAIATTETFTAVTNIFAGATLTGGADCSATNAVTALVTAMTASDTQGVGAVDGAGDTVELTADVAGVSGNNIIIGETMANGVFDGGAVKLSGGVDGTVGSLGDSKLDTSYLYICTADNTTSDKNWRRISVGAVY